MYAIVVFDGPVYPVYSHHMYVIVVFVSKGAKQNHQKQQ
jgi:hypothetical protein